MANIRDNHDTQEESTVSNIHTACSQKQGGYLLNRDGTLKVPWGLLHPMGTDVITRQGIDYTKGVNMKYKYSRVVSLPTFACRQEFQETWHKEDIFPCLAVFVAGPNVSAKGKGRRSSMTRTLDPAASDLSAFTAGVKAAVSSMLRAMIAESVQVAIVPAVSMGLYSGTHRIEFVPLVNDCIREIGNMAPIEEVIVSWKGPPTR